MCTNIELKTKIEMYIDVSNELNKLKKLKEELSAFIVGEMDKRNENANDPENLDVFAGKKIITSRLTENATAAGKQFIKDNAGNDIDKYLSVSLSRYVNTAAAKKIDFSTIQ